MANVNIWQLMRRLYSLPSVPAAIIGPPGIGKTAQVQQAAAALGYPVQTFIGSTADETDIAGVPVNNGHGGTTYLTPEWGLRFQEQPGVLLLDEFNRARPEVLNALLTLIQDRTFPNGRDRLHDHTIIIALMNDAAMIGAEELCPAMNNRFFWFNMDEPMETTHLNWFKTGYTDFDSVAAKNASQQELTGKPKQNPVSIQEWLRFIHEKDENGADLKELYTQACGCELRFARDDAFTTERRTCTPRSLTNLFYFAQTAENAAKYAAHFLDDRNAQIIKTASAKMKYAAPNVAMNSGRGTTASSDDSARLQNAANVSQQIASQMVVNKLIAGNDSDI